MEPYNPFKPIPSLSGTAAINEYLSTEGAFVAAVGYKDSEKNLKLRQYVLKFLQIRSKEHEEFDAFIPYLALNYFDRFMSKTDWPRIVQKDVSKNLELIATSCLLQAGRIRNQNFSSDQFMRKIRQGGLDFEEDRITNMEKNIVDILENKMRPVTAFCFLQHFLYDLPLKPFSDGNIEELIIQSHADIYLAELRPSVITVSAILVGVRKKLHDLEPLIKNEMIIKFNMEEEQVDLCTSKVALLLEKRESMVRGDRICEPGSVQPSSSSTLPRSEVAEASTSSEEVPAELQKLKGREVADAMVKEARVWLGYLPMVPKESSEEEIPAELQKLKGREVADAMVKEARVRLGYLPMVPEESSSEEIPAEFQKVKRKQGRVLGSAQPSSSQDIATQVLSSSAHAGSEVAEASSSKEGQSAEGKRVADSMSMNARKQEFGFAINWVDEVEEVTFDRTLFKPADSALKGILFSLMVCFCLRRQPGPDRH